MKNELQMARQIYIEREDEQKYNDIKKSDNK